MNIETMTLGGALDYRDYLAFGWEHTGDEHGRSGRSSWTRRIFVRDRDMPNYKAITELERQYFLLKSQKKTYEPIDAKWCFVALLCFLVPGIIYIAVKVNQKKRIREHNEQLQKQMDAVLKLVKPLV